MNTQTQTNEQLAQKKEISLAKEKNYYKTALSQRNKSIGGLLLTTACNCFCLFHAIKQEFPIKIVFILCFILGITVIFFLAMFFVRSKNKMKASLVRTKQIEEHYATMESVANS